MWRTCFSWALRMVSANRLFNRATRSALVGDSSELGGSSSPELNRGGGTVRQIDWLRRRNISAMIEMIHLTADRQKLTPRALPLWFPLEWQLASRSHGRYIRPQNGELLKAWCHSWRSLLMKKVTSPTREADFDHSSKNGLKNRGKTGEKRSNGWVTSTVLEHGKERKTGTERIYISERAERTHPPDRGGEK